MYIYSYLSCATAFGCFDICFPSNNRSCLVSGPLVLFCPLTIACFCTRSGWRLHIRILSTAADILQSEIARIERKSTLHVFASFCFLDHLFFRLSMRTAFVKTLSFLYSQKKKDIASVIMSNCLALPCSLAVSAARAISLKLTDCFSHKYVLGSNMSPPPVPISRWRLGGLVHNIITALCLTFDLL